MVRTRRYTVRLPGLTHPLKAVVIGDIQPNNYHWSAARLNRLFSRLQAHESPDVVFWLGDYFNAATDMLKVVLDEKSDLKALIERQMPNMEEIAGAMSALRGRMGDYAILGNHDWAWSGTETEARLSAVGITVLKDEVAVAQDNETGVRLQVAGYEDMSSGRIPAYDRLHQKLDAGIPSVALAHSPDTFKFAADGPGLMLSGHTHGGQVRLPLVGPLVLPLEHTRYDRGWFGDGERRLFVTTGLGTSLPPVRFLCPPEVVILDLVPASDPS